MNKIVEMMWRKTPAPIKPHIQCAYYMAKIPFGYPQSLRKFRYITSVGKRDWINYIPPILDLSVSTICNLRCPTCLFLLKNPNAFKGGDFIEVAKFRAVIDKYAESIEALWIDGGEPLLHPEFDALVQIAKNREFDIRISTNGILISKWIETLTLFNFVNVSIDGYNYESFNRFRGGTKKQFGKVLEGLSLLRETGIEFEISFLLTEQNLDETHKMLEFAYKVHPSIVYFHNINPHGSKKYTSLTLSNRVIGCLERIKMISDYPFDVSLPVIFDPETKHFEKAKCVQPWNICCSDNEGTISYCCHLRHDPEIGNIFSGYDFNSEAMRNFRKLIITHHYPDSCRYCQRRFTSAGERYGYFNARTGIWK